MLNFIIGFVGLGIFGWAGAGKTKGEHALPEIFQGPVGAIVSWIVTIIGLGLVYWGWIRPWISN